VDADAVIALIRDLDFPRFSGSEGERRGQQIVGARLAGVGLTARWHEFGASWTEAVDASITVAGESRPVMPVEELMQWTGDWAPPAEADVEGVLWPAGRLAEAPEGQPVIAVHARPDAEACRAGGPVAQLYLFDETPNLHPHAVLADPFGPPAYVQQQDREWVQARVGQRARVRWRTRTMTRRFRNVWAEVPGPGEGAVLVGAHLDSFPGTPGASDDAFGSAVLVELARWHGSHPPPRTLRFWWFTGEEVDQRGSRAAAEFERTADPRALLMVNVDGGVEAVHGDPLGVRVTGGEEVVAWTRRALSALAIAPQVREVQTGACDAEAFWRAGLPTVMPYATRAIPGPYPHLPTDNAGTVNPELVARLAEIVFALVEAAVTQPPGPM